MDDPLVSVVTCTWKRPNTLPERAIPSVKSQTYPNIEHIIVVDGIDDELDEVLEQHGYRVTGPLRYVHLGRNWTEPFQNESNGAVGRMMGSYLARGEFIHYLDDDNTWQPTHIESMVNVFRGVDTDIVISDVQKIDGGGWDADAHVGTVDTSSFMHRAEILKHGSWDTNGYCCDGLLVEKWVGNGCRWVRKEGRTVTLHGQRKGAPD